MTDEGKVFLKFTGDEALMPREETLERRPQHKKFIIGIPLEKDEYERRIALVPNAVDLLVKNGHQVVVEENAGKAAHFSNEMYAASGAQLTQTAAEVWQSDIIVKIAAPDTDEIDLIHKGQTIFSALIDRKSVV